MIKPVVNIPSSTTAQILFESAQELLGQASFQSLVEKINSSSELGRQDRLGYTSAVSFPHPQAFFQSLEDVYGKPGGRGLAVRMGRAAFRNGLRQQGFQLGLQSIEYRLLTAHRRMEVGLQQIASFISQEFYDTISVTDEGAYWVWRSENCPLCHGRESSDPCCYLAVGMLQEFMTWAGGGRYYRVTEVDCRASKSPACVFQIEKKPLD